MSEQPPTFDFKLDYNEPLGVVKSVLKGYKEAVAQTGWNLTLLNIHPEDAKKLSTETNMAPLSWVTIQENSDIEVGSARFSLEPS